MKSETTGISYASDISNDAKDLINKILRVKPSDRLTFDGIFEHPFIKKNAANLGIQINNYIYKSLKYANLKH